MQPISEISEISNNPIQDERKSWGERLNFFQINCKTKTTFNKPYIQNNTTILQILAQLNSISDHYLPCITQRRKQVIKE